MLRYSAVAMLILATLLNSRFFISMCIDFVLLVTFLTYVRYWPFDTLTRYFMPFIIVHVGYFGVDTVMPVCHVSLLSSFCHALCCEHWEGGGIMLRGKTLPSSKGFSGNPAGFSVCFWCSRSHIL